MMTDRDLDRLLRGVPGGNTPSGSGMDFADAILARLPGMRYVIPGSHPGLRILVVAGILGLLTAGFISLLHRSHPPKVKPPPLTLFQPGAVESMPASASR